MYKPDVGGQGQRESGQLCLRRQTSDRVSSRNPDSGQTPDRIFRKIRTKTRHGQDTDSAVRRRLVQEVTYKIIEKMSLKRDLYFKSEWINYDWHVLITSWILCSKNRFETTLNGKKFPEVNSRIHFLQNHSYSESIVWQHNSKFNLYNIIWR